jgi:hypothetical protein
MVNGKVRLRPLRHPVLAVIIVPLKLTGGYVGLCRHAGTAQSVAVNAAAPSPSVLRRTVTARHTATGAVAPNWPSSVLRR